MNDDEDPTLVGPSITPVLEIILNVVVVLIDGLHMY